ncbi:MAG: C39 family peptidase [bacterium]|nr:C39 family peptidase [bacterium]
MLKIELANRKTLSLTRKGVITLMLFTILLAFLPVSAYGATLDELEQQRIEAAQRANDLKKQAAEKTNQVDDLATITQKLSKQISDLQYRINSLQNKININEKSITETESQIQQKQAELEINMQKQAEAIRTLYVVGRKSTLETLITSNSLSETVARKQYLSALSGKIESMMKEIKQLKKDLEAKKVDLQKRKEDLIGQREQVKIQQADLLNQKQIQNRLLNDTKNALADLQSQQRAMQRQVADIRQKIQALSAQKNWGNGIISDTDLSWYQTQTGNSASLGPYTINDSGCLITSIAMVATFYGTWVTPTTIAGSGYIGSDGLVPSPFTGYGVRVDRGVPVDWSVVNSDLDSNRPVIVSLFIPGFESINSDGSSHFIVLKGRSSDKYIMHDPIGTGRSYSLSQVRSMKRVHEL